VTRRSEWPQERAAGPHQDRGGLVPSRAGARPPHASADPEHRARAVCLRLLTGAPRSRGELAAALRRREFPGTVIERVLDQLTEAGLIDDAAFADAWVDSRHHGRGLARPALARELRAKGVDAALIEGALSQLDAEREEETARALVERKLRATRGLDPAKRLRRMVGMLARRGYPEGMAVRVVREALREEGQPEDAELLPYPDD
jgi:regulatory protein